MTKHDKDYDVVEDMALETERMVNCLKVAMGIFSILQTKAASTRLTSNIVTVELTKEDVQKVLDNFKIPPLAKLRMSYVLGFIGELIASSSQYGGHLDLCLVWELAHKFHHVFWDEDLPPMSIVPGL